MIIRKLNDSENKAWQFANSVCFNVSYDPERDANARPDCEYAAAFTDDGDFMSGAALWKFDANFCGESVPVLGFGSVATLPQYRRRGCIRKIFEQIFSETEERQLTFSLLHPFSYRYYEKFGYKRVMRTKTIKCPISALAADRYSSLTPLADASKADDYKRAYAAFAKKYNFTFDYSFFRKFAFSLFPTRDRLFTYLCGDRGYVTFMHKNRDVTVTELAYDGVDTLRKLIGFIANFEGQADNVVFSGLPEDSPVEYLLGEYTGAEITLESSLAGRVLSVERALKANCYPNREGGFRLTVKDPMIGENNSAFDVSYGGGKHEVKRVKPCGDAIDISLVSPILMRCQSVTEETAELFGLPKTKDAEDFYRAFSPLAAFCPDHF